ncbi:MAG: dUTP diphosphatase [Clostridiales bacterium]|nr:dUTP diphosphatase [Clostridiales bacterium]
MKIKLLTNTARLPRRTTDGSAGYDLSADLIQPEEIAPGEVRMLRTGVAVALPAGTVGLVFGRSGLGVRHGIVPANAVGVIDADYRGELMVGLRNQGSVPYMVQPGERIAQLVVVPVLTPELEPVPDLGETARGENGFGSTGTN